jgi:glutamyl/glutaminyl-tRNA synthetase
MTHENVITRFAPSPTGNLHVGGARTALFNWAFARRHGGKFLLRIEDTDQKRSSEAALQGILRDLKWVGLNWDNHDDVPRQSQRLAIYDGYAKKLLDSGQAYEDDRAVRFKMDRDIAFDDEVYGHIEVKAAELEDFVIKKADGFPTFHLAVVVDDAEMKITHVIRGQEHLSNTPKHIALQKALGFTRPIYAHTPSIMNSDGSKMSKRDKAKVARAAAFEFKQKHGHSALIELNAKQVSSGPNRLKSDPDDIHGSFMRWLDGEFESEYRAIHISNHFGIVLPDIDIIDFEDSGYLPETLCNYISLLGWNPGDNIEHFGMNFLAQNFSLDRIGKSNAKFDRDKLASFNGATLQAMPLDVYAKNLREYAGLCHEYYLEKLGDRSTTFAQMYQPRGKTLADPFVLGRFFFEDDFNFNAKAVKKNLIKNDGQGLQVLREFPAELENLDDWQAASIQALIESFVAEKELKNMGSVAQPLRVAISGDAVTPPIDQTLELLGKEEVIKRIEHCLNTINAEAK